MRFLYVLKMYHVRLFIVEKMGFGTGPRRCEIHSKPQSLLQKTCFSYTSLTLVAYVGICLRTHVLAHVHRPRPAYTGQGLLQSYYFKKQIFTHSKGYIFHFNTPQVNLISDWALNWPWALEFEHHREIGARVVNGTKCGVYNVLSRQIDLRHYLSLTILIGDVPSCQIYGHVR